MANKKEYQFSVDINGNVSGLDKAMKEATALVRRTANTIKNIDTAIQSDPNDINLLKTKQQLYTREIKETIEAIKDLKDIQDDLVVKAGGKQNVGLEFSKLEKEIRSYKSHLKDLEKQQKAVNLEISNFTFNQKMNKLASDLDKVRNSSEKIKQSLSNIGEQLKFDPYDVDLYAQKQDILSQKLKNVNDELEVLQRKKKLLSNDLFRKKTEDEIQIVEENEIAIRRLNKQKEHLEYVIRNKLSPSMQAFATRTQALSEYLGNVSFKTHRLSTFFSGLMADSFSAAMHYETNVAEIEKVTGKLSDTVVNDLKDMAVETGNSFEEIAEYATISGALGLAEDEIVSFTRAMVDLNAVSGGAFSGEYGAKGIAVFLKQLGLTNDYAENFASAIAMLGDKYADIGDETVNLATKLTGLNSIIKTDQFELLGLSAVMADLGLSGDTSANAINRAFLQIEKVLAGGVKDADVKLNAMATTANMTSSQFAKAWESNAMDTFLRFVDGLSSSVFNEINDSVVKSTGNIEKYASALGMTVDEFKQIWSQDSRKTFELLVENLESIGDEGISASKVLSQMGIASVNTAQTLLRLAGSGNEVRSAISLATKAWNENTAIQEKTGILYNTTQSKLKSFNESLNQLKASMVEGVLPSLKMGVDFFTRLIQTFSKMSPVAKNLSFAFLSIGASISPVTRGLSVLARDMFKVDKETGEFIKTAGKFTLSWKGMTSVIALSAAAILGFAGALETAYKNTERYKMFEDINNNYSNSVQQLEEMNKSLRENAFAYELQSAGIKKQMTNIEELNSKLVQGNLTEEESKKTKEDLIKKIDELNTSMGGSFYYWDETSQKIRDENGEIVGENGLIKSYDKLELARKKAFIMDSLENQYIDALQIEKQAVEAIAKIDSDYEGQMIKYFKDMDADFVNNAQLYAQALFEANESGKKIPEWLSKWVNGLDEEQLSNVQAISSLYLQNNKMIEDQINLLNDATKIKEDYLKIQSAEGDELANLVDMYSSFGTTDMNEALEQAQKQIDDINETLERRAIMEESTVQSLEESKAKYEEQLATMKEIYDTRAKGEESLTKDASSNAEKQVSEIASKYEQLYDPQNGRLFVDFTTLTTAEETAQKTMADNSAQYLTDAYKIAADNIVQDFSQRTLKMNGVVNLKDSSGRDVRQYNYPFETSGYGDTMLDSLSRSFRSSMSKGFASGGMMSSNSIVVNNSFTINGSEGLTEAALMGYADIITDRVNENLGRMI